MIHYRRRLILSTYASGTATPWYLSGGIDSAHSIGAWRPEQAASLAASYVNLVTPGTHDMIVLTAPALASGWVADGSACLRSDIVEQAAWTTLIKYSGVNTATADSAYMYGQYQSGVGIRGIVPVATGPKHNIINGGGIRQVVGVLTSGIIVIAASNIYLNGFIEATFASTADLTSPFGILGLYNGSAGSNKLDAGKILAFATYDTTLTPGQVRQIGEALGQTYTTFTILGDSISTEYIPGNSWPATVISGYSGSGTNVLKNRAVSGNDIMTDMATQTTAAANDYADIIIIALGSNDNNAGDMGALQTEVETNIATIKTNHPRATIYYMNVLPCAADKGNIRTAIAAACTAQSITCWDTSSWLVVETDLSDGQHPNAGGLDKIAAQVLARL